MRGGILAELARVDCQAGYASLLQRCADPRLLPEAKLLHSHIARHPLHSRSLLLRNHIVHAYARCGSLADARAAFDAIPAKNVFSWSIIIAAYTRHGHHRQALDLFDQMEANPSAAPPPNAFVLSTALGACSALRDLGRGERIHSRIQQRRSDLGGNMVVLETALLRMYASCGCVVQAEEIFQAMGERDVIAWNAMISAYAHTGHHTRAFGIFRIMLLEAAVTPSATTIHRWRSRCSACIHDLGGNLVVLETALLRMYASCGCVVQAEEIFQAMGERDVIAWNAMISAYAQNGHHTRAFGIFRIMLLEAAVTPSATTISAILAAWNSRHLGAVSADGFRRFPAGLSNFRHAPRLLLPGASN